MLKFASALVLIFLFTIPASDSLGVEPGRERHDKELVFGLSGLDNIRLNTFDGDFGLRYFLSSKFALRPSFSIGQEEYVRPAYYDDWTPETSSGDSKSFSLVLERYLAVHGRVSSYMGLGFAMGESTSTYAYSHPVEVETGSRTGSESTNKFKSVLALFGVQWSASDAIRFGCEYKLRYRCIEQEAQEFLYDEDDFRRTSSSKSLNASTSTIYIAVQF